MSAIAVAALLALAAAIAVSCCVGILVMRTSLQRLHYVGPAAVACPILIAIAITISRHPTSLANLKAWCIAAVMVTFGPVLSHQTGRAIAARGDR